MTRVTRNNFDRLQADLVVVRQDLFMRMYFLTQPGKKKVERNLTYTSVQINVG